MRALIGLLAAFVLSTTVALPAHHSFAATYDADKPVSFSGIVTSVEFRNPHIWVFFDVQGAGGITNWGCEGGAPNQLFRQGWRPDTLKAGDRITVEGFAGRDGTPICNMRVVRLSDGRQIFAGANDGGPGAGDRRER